MDPRAQMIADIRSGFARTVDSTGVKEPPPAVLDAMERVPRERFVPPAHRRAAFEDRALPIGDGATISQPFIVALMTTLAQVSPGDRVLEVGSGSGYQAAVLAELGAEVLSLEVAPALCRRARALLEDLGYHRVRILEADGWRGLEAEAPYDAILVTACAPSVPPALLGQLVPGGRLVIPLVGGRQDQDLLVIHKDAQGGLTRRGVLPVKFVPLVRV
jgi:protein-L-isoaspartate(D-aspartate) O-methyltransferase